MTSTETATADTKQWRKDLDEVLQRIKDQSGLNPKCDSSSARKSRERSLAVTKIQEAIMWLGMDLKDLKDIGETPNPYPHSYDPTSPVIEPTADGLKL
jgi:hypothetical protein